VLLARQSEVSYVPDDTGSVGWFVVQRAGAHLVLVRAASASVLPALDPTPAEYRAAEEAETYLADLADRIAGQSIPAETAVPYGAASEAILTEIALHRADLVVMCTHGLSGLGRWIYGPVAETVLARSPAPILLVRPTGSQATLSSEPAGSRLLVPLDGSDFAEAALPHAAALARAVNGSLHLLQVLVPPSLPYANVAGTVLMSAFTQLAARRWPAHTRFRARS
jgi:nucleotide-binding universal stress UspA family protein